MIVESAASAMLAFALGGRHGLDADHLAAIDGLTRWNASAGRRVAPLWNGLWVARLLRHSSNSSQRAGRVMTLTIALTAFAVAGRVLLPLVAAEWDRWVGEYELVASGGVMTLVLGGYITSLLVASRAQAEAIAPVAGTPDIAS